MARQVKPKFKIGQVVMVKRWRIYERISFVGKDGVCVRSGNYKINGDIRPLTVSEIGPHPRIRKAK